MTLDVALLRDALDGIRAGVLKKLAGHADIIREQVDGQTGR